MLKDDILKRAEKDQDLRFAIQNPKNTTVTWDDIINMDADNTLWLKSVIEKEGWPTISVVGKEASHGAWLMVQHADADVAFQEHCLQLMEKAWKSHDVSPKNLAYLIDRVAVNKGLPQTYGTQFNGKIISELLPHPIKDRESLDQRRKEMELEDFGVYQKRMRGEYSSNKESEKLGNLKVVL